ncbi:hypothetical protein PR048_011687 [Dryococelus australis]|uniref:Secreted protein n=1 Tax=Dryococelus australis TaxID=614101 RepID=A0ABQ9HMX2_9NEOP|nr:hypothetical protein PR048_011687 [Dryococelus australis]
MIFHFLADIASVRATEWKILVLCTMYNLIINIRARRADYIFRVLRCSEKILCNTVSVKFRCCRMCCFDCSSLESVCADDYCNENVPRLFLGN